MVKKGWTDLPITKLVQADWNYKEDDEQQDAKLLANLKRNGQVETIIVREHPKRRGYFEVVNGNHRQRLFKEAGIEVVHVFNMGKVSDAAAQRVAIETNETRFETNDLRLAGLLDGLAEEFGKEDLVGTMPYDDTTLDEFSDLLKFEWPKPSKGPKAPGDGTHRLGFDLTEEQWNTWVSVMQKSGISQPDEVFLSMCELALRTDNWPDSQAG